MASGRVLSDLLLLLLALPLVGDGASAQAPGAWSAPFNHRIIDGPTPGEVSPPLVNPADWITNDDPSNVSFR
jgi:hypothetical protein